MESGFQCEYCDKPFTAKKNLKRHYQKQHRDKKIPLSFKDLKGNKEKGEARQLCQTNEPTTSNMAGMEYTAEYRERKRLHRRAIECQAREEGDLDDEDDLGLDNGPSYAQIWAEETLKEQEQEYEQGELKNFKRFLIEDQHMQANSVGKYMSSLKNFLSYANVKEVFDKKDLKDLLESEENYFESFINSLETVGSRSTAFKTCKKLLEYVGIKLQGEGIPHVIDYLQIYLVSQKRRELFANFDLKHFGDNWEARNFVMAEVLLSTQSDFFLKTLTVEAFEEIKTPNGQGMWQYCNSNTSKSFYLPKSVHHLIRKYIEFVLSLIHI